MVRVAKGVRLARLLYFEEFSVGQKFDHALRRTVTEADNVLFSAMTHNPAPLHLDEEYMKGTEFGARLVNSLFTLGLMVGISVQETTLGTTVANLGMDEVRFPKPVFHGDTLHVESEVLELRESKSRPDQRHRCLRPPRHQSEGRDRGELQTHGADAEEAHASTGSAQRDERSRPMILRSLLFVPADSEKKLAKARAVPADALILDLEDSVAPANRAKARALAREFLKEKHPQSIWVRINPVGSADYRADLAEIARLRRPASSCPSRKGPKRCAQLDRDLSDIEKARGLPQRAHQAHSRSPPKRRCAVLSLMDYRNPPPRLAALTWGAEDLSAALGAATNREADGEFAFTYKMVRSLALIAAKAAGVEAIETVHADLRDAKGLERVARTARRDGFSGMLAIHPDQVEIINAAFTPSPDEVAQAARIVAAFAGGAGVTSLDGNMLDRPHLKQAQNILALAETLKRK